jgi:hypothetical protein
MSIVSMCYSVYGVIVAIVTMVPIVFIVLFIVFMAFIVSIGLVHRALNTRPVITRCGGSRFGVRRHDAAFRSGIQQHNATRLIAISLPDTF